MGMPSRSLKFATLFLATVATACWPVIAVMSLMTASSALALSLQSPQPTLTTIFSIFGICITLSYWNFVIRAGATSSTYFFFIEGIFAIVRCSLLYSSAPHFLQTRTFLPSVILCAMRVGLPHFGQTTMTLQA